MMRTLRTAKRLLSLVGLYRPTRAIYRAVFRRGERKHRAQLREFYSQFLSPGDLVFDIGANVGFYAEVFASLGARVVAVEPNPECIQYIRNSCENADVSIVEAAIGSAQGSGFLNINHLTALSSMSPEWISVAKKSKRFQGLSWNEEMKVKVVTLNSLVGRYGQPKFIKLDIEGFEEQALQGMSTQPRLLSLEFNIEYLAHALLCINNPRISCASRFNYVIGEPVALELQSWVSREELESRLSKLQDVATFGDIFVRL